MELSFENPVNIDIDFPCMLLHDKDNSIHLIRKDGDYFFKRRWNPGLGDVDWQNPEFGSEELTYGSSRIVNWKRLTDVGSYGLLYLK
jgi:hypothetical protein